MLILGIDSSGSIGALGLYDEKGFLAETNIKLFHRHSEELLTNINFVLKQSGKTIEEVSAIAVVTGPGSFTGLRIALSTAKTFAQVLDIPLLALSSLDVLAYNINVDNCYIVPLIDAKRERVYMAAYRKWSKDIKAQKVIEDKASSIEDLLDELSELDSNATFYLTGDGAEVYQKFFRKSSLNYKIATDNLNIPRGGAIAEMGYYYFQEGKAENYLEIFPNYMKKPQAEINWLKKYGTGESNGN